MKFFFRKFNSSTLNVHLLKVFCKQLSRYSLLKGYYASAELFFISFGGLTISTHDYRCNGNNNFPIIEKIVENLSNINFIRLICNLLQEQALNYQSVQMGTFWVHIRHIRWMQDFRSNISKGSHILSNN
jgi:hypothetical protein